ncbi:MAG: O-antigen ligase family protein [Hyphomicrobium sp.]|jgi:O-antigen ligase
MIKAPPFRDLSAGGHADVSRHSTSGGSLESLASRLAGWLPPLIFFYVLIVWPLVFGDPLPTLADDTLGWLVVEDTYPKSIWKSLAYPVLSLLAFACLLLTAGYRRIPFLHAGVLLLLAFAAYAFASVAWSVVPSISALRAALFFAITLGLVGSVYAAPANAPIVTRLFWVVFLTAVLNTGALFVRERTQLGYSGIYDHKNVFGWVAALVMYFGLYRLVIGDTKERLAAVFMIATAPIFLILSESKTSLGLAALSPALATVLWLGAREFRVSPALVFAVLVVVLAFVFQIGHAAGLWDFHIVNNAIFGNPTLTGRTEIWSFTLGLIWDQPLFGYGYEGVFSTGADGLVVRKAVGFIRVMPTAHNGYLDIWVQLGIVGLTAVILFALIALDAIGRLSMVRPDIAWLFLTITLFTLLHNFLESDVFISSNPLSMLTLLAFFMAIRMRAEQDRAFAP